MQLASEELSIFARKPQFEAAGFAAVYEPGSVEWLRYVDDGLAFSFCFCSRCLEEFFAMVYCEPLSFVFSSTRARAVAPASADEARVLHEFNRTGVSAPSTGSVLAAVAEAAARWPDAPAVRSGGRDVTYAQLWRIESFTGTAW